jgi:hypothetical protein
MQYVISWQINEEIASQARDDENAMVGLVERQWVLISYLIIFCSSRRLGGALAQPNSIS